jgi:hypothetical protein
MRLRAAVVAVVLAVSVVGCSGGEGDDLSLPASEAEQYTTAYMSRVVPAPEGDVLVLRDSAGGDVATFAYGDAETEEALCLVDQVQGQLLSRGC